MLHGEIFKIFLCKYFNLNVQEFCKTIEILLFIYNKESNWVKNSIVLIENKKPLMRLIYLYIKKVIISIWSHERGLNP